MFTLCNDLTNFLQLRHCKVWTWHFVPQFLYYSFSTMMNESYSDVKSQEKIDRNHWNSNARNSFRFYRWEWSLLLNLETSEKGKICREVVRLSLFYFCSSLYIFEYIPAKSWEQFHTDMQRRWKRPPSPRFIKGSSNKSHDFQNLNISI